MKKDNKLKVKAQVGAKKQITSNKKQVGPPIKGKAKEFSFFQDVFDVARQIPKGRVTSYGAIANYIGTKLSARMVGWAMKRQTKNTCTTSCK
jgi:O6-methylguanine-DNA--protein-cysteine methyltransferase